MIHSGAHQNLPECPSKWFGGLRLGYSSFSVPELSLLGSKTPVAASLLTLVRTMEAEKDLGSYHSTGWSTPAAGM